MKAEQGTLLFVWVIMMLTGIHIWRHWNDGVAIAKMHCELVEQFRRQSDPAFENVLSKDYNYANRSLITHQASILDDVSPRRAEDHLRLRDIYK
jgi:hypothetical protein